MKIWWLKQEEEVVFQEEKMAEKIICCGHTFEDETWKHVLLVRTRWGTVLKRDAFCSGSYTREILVEVITSHLRVRSKMDLSSER